MKAVQTRVDDEIFAMFPKDRTASDFLRELIINWSEGKDSSEHRYFEDGTDNTFPEFLTELDHRVSRTEKMTHELMRFITMTLTPLLRVDAWCTAKMEAQHDIDDEESQSKYSERLETNIQEIWEYCVNRTDSFHEMIYPEEEKDQNSGDSAAA